MKVLLLCGSPNKDGCTETALREVAGALEAEKVGTALVRIPKDPVRGCVDCGACTKTQRCAFGRDDGVNAAIEQLIALDGLIIGSPVYYASPNGALLSFLDRMFFAASSAFAYKPGAAVVSARRAGTTASLDVLSKYFLISNMPIVPSQYWNMVHGNSAEEVRQDTEGLQIMRTLGRNMAWLLRCLQAGGPPPSPETPRMRTNFIR